MAARDTLARRYEGSFALLPTEGVKSDHGTLPTLPYPVVVDEGQRLVAADATTDIPIPIGRYQDFMTGKLDPYSVASGSGLRGEAIWLPSSQWSVGTTVTAVALALPEEQSA